MFTADEFQLMKSKCPSELEKFLNKLSIRNPDSNGKDDFSVYGKLDDEITAEMCRLMKSDSVVQGYTKLLDFGKVSYSYRETNHELLDKVIANKDKIIQGIKDNRDSRQSKNAKVGKESVEITTYTVNETEKFDKNNIVYDLEQCQRSLDNESRTSSSDELERIIFIPESNQALQHLKGFFNEIIKYVKNSKTKNFDKAKKIVKECIEKVNTTGDLFKLAEPKTDVEEKSLPDYIRHKVEEIPVGGSKTICITIKKSTEVREEESTGSSIESGFDESEIEKIFNVLEQANRIVQSI